jgi:protease-4
VPEFKEESLMRSSNAKRPKMSYFEMLRLHFSSICSTFNVRRCKFGICFFFLLLMLIPLAGCGAPSILITPVQDANTLDETTVADGKGWFPDKIAIVEVEGMIENVKGAGLLTPGENPVSRFVQELDKVEKDDSVKAVVLRVNSPGGTVSASDAMYQILKRFKARTHKPVVASIQELGASGAYYVSCGADKIVAQPTSLVGSIGVIFETYNLEGTMEKLGVRPENYKSAAHKDIGSPFREATPDEKTIMQNLVNEYYAKFKGIVSSNRPITDPAEFPEMTDGRIFSGEDAQKLGLVDQTGLLEDAIQLARDLAKSPNAKVVEYKHPYASGGSIYALNSTPLPQSNTLHLDLPDAATMLPSGFYYLWRP